MQYAVDVNQARLDAVESVTGTSAILKIFSGAATANCAAADPSGLLCTMNLPSDWMAAADTTPKKVMAGSWTGTASAGSATAPQSFRIYTTGGSVCKVQGTAGVASGELQVNGSITSGQTVTVTAFQINAGNV